MQFTFTDFTMLVGFLGTLLGIYGKFKSDIITQEKRLTVLEKDVEYLTEFKNQANKRLDNHDKQNEALVRLSTNIEYLSEKVDAIDKRLGGTQL